jgi:hypothetical protein
VLRILLPGCEFFVSGCTIVGFWGLERSSLVPQCMIEGPEIWGFATHCDAPEEKQFGAPVQIGSFPSLGPLPTPLKGVPGVGGNLPFGLVLRIYMICGLVFRV